MKILHVSTHLEIGGIPRYILMVGARLREKGHDVWSLSSGGALLPELEQKGIQCVTMPLRTKNEFHPKLFLLLPAILRLVKKERFDLVHAHTRVTQVLAALVSRLANVPYCTTAHGYYRRRLSRRLFDGWGKRVIAISPMVAQELEKVHRIGPRRIRLVQNAIDLEEVQTRCDRKNPLASRRSYGIPDKAKVMVSISRLVRDKGHNFLIKALAELKKTHPDLHLMILGEGRERNALSRLTEELNVERDVTFVDRESDVTKVLVCADIFVHPATFKEGFGFSIAEAMALKIPVVATDIWAVNDYIHHGENGFLAKPSDTQSLIDVLSEVLADPVNALSVSEKAYESLRSFSSVERMVTGIEEVYREVVRN